MFAHRPGHLGYSPDDACTVMRVTGDASFLPRPCLWVIQTEQGSRDQGPMSVHEIAELLGVSRRRDDELSRTHRDFPESVAVLAPGWTRKVSEIEAWPRGTSRMRE